MDKFFTDYNAIAEVPIPADEIEKGNIRTKALVYIDDLSLEIINAPDSLSISMSSSVENEQTLLYSVFRDSILAVRAEVTEDEIKSAWDTIHESVLASGVPSHILSGITDHFLSENREPINEFLDCQQPRLANCLFLRCHRLNSLNLASLH